MQAIYDSITKKLILKGDHNGNPRIWRVTVNLTFSDGQKQRLTFNTKTKILVSLLPEMIIEHIKAEIKHREVPVIRQQWTAIGR